MTGNAGCCARVSQNGQATQPPRTPIVANITGYSDQNLTIVKRAQLLHELVPEAKLIALLSNNANRTNFDRESRQVQTAASTLGLNLLILSASSPSDLEKAFVNMARQR